MGGLPQLVTLLAVAFAIFFGVVLLAFLLGKLFRNKRTRKRIMIGSLVIYALAFLGYFAFILSGNLNEAARDSLVIGQA